MQGQWQGQYEFNEAQNAVIGKLAQRMRLAGIAQLVFAVMDIVGSCKIQASEGGGFTANGSSPFAIVLFICAIFIISSANSFAKIVKTQGWDMSHLMVAVQSYSKAMLVQFIAYVIMAVFLALFLLLILLMILFFAAFLGSMMK